MPKIVSISAFRAVEASAASTPDDRSASLSHDLRHKALVIPIDSARAWPRATNFHEPWFPEAA